MVIPHPQPFTPLYYQIEQQILEEIHQGRLKPGDRLPSEPELSRRFGVSRITIRRALKDLSQQGIIYSRQGKGTFVAQARIREISGFRSFSDDIRARGLTPSSRVVDFNRVPADEMVAQRLGVEVGESVYCLQRVRLANDQPVAFEIAYLPERLCPDLERFDFSTASLYAVLREHYRVFPTWAEAEIEASAASPEVAHHLGMKIGEPVLVAYRQTYTERFEIIEFVKSIYCGKRFTFYVGRQYIGN
ncbi:MAG: GntR family transcriptional regulator [Thermanaerothrix sp.]|nr:GntR family transcriptional regulator [Thermanaerothrix sp.]